MLSISLISLVIGRFNPMDRPTPSYPLVARAEEDQGALMLHFTVNGHDRLFFVDSGAYYSTYDPKQWKLPKGVKALVTLSIESSRNSSTPHLGINGLCSLL